MDPKAYINFLEVMILVNDRERPPSQLLQDVFALFFNNFKKGGYFVEFGATDGYNLSNTHLLEKKFGWQGILAEPLPSWHEKLQENRSCIIDTRCVYSSTGKTLSFADTYQFPELAGIKSSLPADKNQPLRANQRNLKVETVSLNDLLAEHQAPQQIDYLSIDTEGSELDILQAFDFDKYRIETLTVEHNFVEPQRQKLKKLLESKGLARFPSLISQWDDWYVQADNPYWKMLHSS